MVFSSHEFVLIFLPLVFLAFAIANRFGGWQASFSVLGAASLVFYAQWSIALLAVLLTSAVANYIVGTFLIKATKEGRPAGWLLVSAVIANLVALGYFKYTNFFIDITNQVSGSGFSHLDIVLPVGISFYTFIQIGFLVEAHSGQAEQQPFIKYLTFATFFPCVTAGPLVLQREFFDQMKDRKDSALEARRLAVGVTLFAMGLFKKVVLADSIAPFANDIFAGVAAGGGVDMVSAWVGALAYSLQLYFDFSGYSDMAIGIGVIFGIRLPLNFNSPFKATSISEFWQRWHMTMTRFFTKFVYSPMAMRGMRSAVSKGHSPLRRYLVAGAWPIVVTMLVAGVWHGSGWTFVLFGLLHGVAIAVNNGWKHFSLPKPPAVLGWLMTISVVICGLVIFRAPDVASAMTMLTAMWGISAEVPANGHLAVALGLREALGLIFLLGAITLLAPNTQEILAKEWVSSDPVPKTMSRIAGYISWRPAMGWSFAAAGTFLLAFTSISADSSFLYYQF
ncbi:MBOAT family O-acyltransferase [Roseibium sp. HPY-6]|uniref:MBOAT family O-acyltransferase n=1 Tax=Roseibium sp. HPY-6 TaxID=3229852 RepID=UPI00338F8821